jgi:hypothetical protein
MKVVETEQEQEMKKKIFLNPKNDPREKKLLALSKPSRQ